MPKYLSIFGSKHIISLFFGAFSWAVVPLAIVVAEPSSMEGSNPKSGMQVLKEVGPDRLNGAAEEKQAILPGSKHANQEKVKELENMVLIPAGEYTRGADPIIGYNECKKYGKSCEMEWYGHEVPVHNVWINAFYIGKYEVTQKEFEEMMGKNPSRFKGDNLPVERVLWTEANEYCEKAGKRLPTEAEWEKAARGGTDTLYPWGNEVESGKANFCDVNCKAYIKAQQFDDGYKTTAPVGSYPPNGYGLYDMAGNVWEWVSDWFDKKYYENAPRKNPKGPPKGMKKGLRGGSWGNNASAMRISSRSWAHNSRVSRRGFRCAADATSMP